MLKRALWCLGWLLLACASAWAAPKRVFVVESYHSEYPWDQDYRRALQERLSPRCELAFYTLDSKRLPGDQVRQRAEEALQKIRAFNPDLVIVGDDAALQKVGRVWALQGKPVIYLGINNNPRNYFDTTPPNISGVLERPLILRNIFELGRSIKGMRRALTMFDSDLTSRIIRDETFVGRDSIRLGDIDVDISLTDSFAAWQQKVLDAPKQYQAIWIGLYFTLRDKNGKVVDGAEVLRWTEAHSKLPLFAFWNFSVGKGKTAGGLVLTGYEQGKEAAAMANAYLFGGKPLSGLFPVTPSEGEYLFSRSELARYGITLPEKVRARSRWLE